MDKKRQEKYIADEFNRTAEGYDKSRLVKSFQSRAQKLVISKMKIDEGMSVLDLGCGTGQGTIEIGRLLKGTGKVIGLDLSEKMIDQAIRKLDDTIDMNITFETMSGSSLDYVERFDYVISTNAFHHFHDKEDIFLRVKRALKSCGIFIVQDICDDFLLMRLVDYAGKLGEKAHVGSTTSRRLREIFHVTGYEDIIIEKVNLTRLWKIMIGQGKKV
ncbi:MAG: methyltransferase domain-containing protein [Dehalococcoidales bacterium]|nr:methyltransferase domain-containing protein [Dehalococcoidales bacterium]